MINSPSTSNRRALNLADITLEESSTQGQNVGKFLPGKERDEFSYHAKEPDKDTSRKAYFNKQTSPVLQQQNEVMSTRVYKEKEPYSKFPYVYEREIYTNGRQDEDVEYRNRKSSNEFSFAENYRDLQRHGARSAEARSACDATPKARSVDIGARNISPGARVVSPGAHNGEPRTRKSSAEARNVGLGTRNAEHDDERNDKTKTSPSIFSVRIENPEGFQKPRATYVEQDVRDGNYLYQHKGHYLANNTPVSNKQSGQNSTNQERQAQGQMPGQSRSEINLKSPESLAERPVYFVAKTLSDPTGLPPDHEARNDARTSKGSSVTCLVGTNTAAYETQPQSLGIGGHVPLARNRELESKERKKSREKFPVINKQLEKYETKHNADTLQGDRSKMHSKVDESPLQMTKQPYERKHTSSPVDSSALNSVSCTAGGKNTPQADEVAGLGKQNVNNSERAKGEIFGGLLGDADAKHSAEYYDRMISKINEQINLAVSRNKSHYAMYGLGSDDDDDWC